MKRTPKISEAEWEVMKTLWEKSPLTANDIVETLSKRTRWQRETIRTLINRLVQKNAVAFEKEGRQHHYYPVVAETECIRSETQSFIRRVYQGAMKPALAAFLEGTHLSPREIEELQEILDHKRKG